MQNIYSYQLIVELEGLQPSGLYIHEQMYITFPSSLVPSSPVTAYHQIRQTSTIGQFQAGLGSIRERPFNLKGGVMVFF
jgi:hypothetical protein